MESTPANHGLSRRDALKVGGAALALAVTGSHHAAAPAEAQTPKRGGVLRLTVQADPLHFDPHQTISFVTMVPLSLVYSRLVKVKAGPSVRPMTYPIEPDLAESWTQQNDTTYVFKLRKGVRWHPKPPLNGRELTADDVKYTYERFLTITGNPNKPVLEYVDRIEAVDKHTVKFTLKEPNAWFLDLLASTSTWIVAKECVEKFGDLKKVESVVGTGPWMLERWEPNVKLVYVRNPNYFVSGLPYADGVDMLIDKDPSSRLATWLSGKTDFGPEYQHAVRWLDAPLARQRKPGLQTAEYTWLTSGSTGFKLANPPFGDLRVRRAMARASNVAEVFEALAFSQGHWTPNPIVPAAFAEWSIPIDQLGPEGKKLYEFNTAEAKRLLAEAGLAKGFTMPIFHWPGYVVPWRSYYDLAAENLGKVGITVELKPEEYGKYISTTALGKYEGAAMGPSTPFTEVDDFLFGRFYPELSTNQSHVADAELTKMLVAQRREMDPKKRKQIVDDIQRYLADKAYYVYVPQWPQYVAHPPYVKGFRHHDGYGLGMRLLYTWLDK